jgi:hypothetical protein
MCKLLLALDYRTGFACLPPQSCNPRVLVIAHDACAQAYQRQWHICTSGLFSNGSKSLFMKIVLTLSFLILANASFGARIYKLSKEDFQRQFSDSVALSKNGRVYCSREDGRKVWLFFNEGTTLTVHQAADKQRLLLRTVRYSDGLVTGRAPDALGLPKNRHSIWMEDVVAFEIERRAGEGEMPYFNDDSARVVAQLKNDSLVRWCKADNSTVIYLKSRKDSGLDTITLVQEACYTLRFRDGQRANFGVIQRLTPDSIYISTGFSPTATVSNGAPYTILAYPIREIAFLELLKSGGYSTKKAMLEDYDVVPGTSNGNYCPLWYSGAYGGELRLFRRWLTASGYAGISEQNGKVIWAER